MPRRLTRALAAALLLPAAAGAQSVSANFGSTVTPTVDPLVFAVVYVSPVPADAYASVTLRGSLTLTAAGVGAGVTLHPGTPAYLQAYGRLGAAPGTLLGSLGTAPCIAAVGSTVTCALTTSTFFFASTAFDALELRLAYTHSGVGSSAAWTAGAELGQGSVVPEPATVALLATGLLVVGAATGRGRGAFGTPAPRDRRQEVRPASVHRTTHTGAA